MNQKLHFPFLLSVIVLMSILLPAQERKELSFPSGMHPDILKQLSNLTGNTFSLNKPFARNSVSETAANEFWSSDFGLPGIDQFLFYSIIHTVAATENEIYIGGTFRYAQDSLVNYIAKLDGVKFCPLGDGTNGPVYAIKIADGNVYVGGDFDTAGTVPANNIAMWDGSAWHSLGLGVTGSVMTIEAGGGNIFVGGDFDSAGTSPANNIARWNGSDWSALGNGTSGTVNTLKIVGSELYLGGDFDSAGTMLVNNIAKWDGLDYDSLGSGTNGDINNIDADGSAVYAGGYFSHAGGIAVNNVAKWQSDTWSKIGSGVDGEVNDILSFNGSLYIGGFFSNVGILPANGIARWDGLQWSTFGEGMNLSIYSYPGVIFSLAILDDYLFAGGAFDRAGNISANSFAYWDGLEWKGVGPVSVIGGSNYVIFTAVVHNGELYTGGAFNRIGNIVAKGIAKWNGTSWIEIGGGVTSFSGPGMVSSICFVGNDIYIGGDFDIAGSVYASNIAKWNGSEWSALDNGVNKNVWDIKAAGGSIYAAGTFDSAGSVHAKGIALWNGSSWSALGIGLNGSVRSILPVGAELYAAGSFILSGTDTLNRIAKWDGFSWSKLGKGFNNDGLKLLFDNGLLYAGGAFTEADGNPANFIAVWNGSSWMPVGTGLSYSSSGGGVTGLVMADGNLYAGGLFDQAGLLAANDAAVYDGVSWQPLGAGIGGLSTLVYSSLLDYRGTSDYDVYFTGIFSLAGGKPSYNIAKYCVTTVDVEENGSQVPKEYSLMQNYPNPFNPVTKIKFSIPELSVVSLRIFDVLGNETAVLLNDRKAPGEYEVELNARNLSSGVYFYQLKAGSFIQTKKMLLLK